MAAPTARPLAAKQKGLCFGCHAQLLDVLKPDQFIRDGRAGDDEGYWMLSIVIGRCEACKPPLTERFARSFFEMAGHDMSVVYDVCLTAKQHAEAVTSTMVGAVADAPERVQNGNIQLANMRANSIVGADIGDDTLYKEAIFQIWPFVTALLASSDADSSTFSNNWCCCGGRTAVLRNQKYIMVRKSNRPVRDFGDHCPEWLDPPDGSYLAQLRAESRSGMFYHHTTDETVEEQIHGRNDLHTDIPHVTLICDEDPDKGTRSEKDALAAKFGPTTTDRVFYDNTPARVNEAIDKRITQKHVEFDMTDLERDELTAVTDHFCDEIRESDSIDRIASWLLFGNLKSKKWTISRAEMALNVLMWQLNPDFSFAAAIKLEPMGKGKPPRMLIADGDAGAVMSALTIGVLERYICRYYKNRTIKGKPKSARMTEICKEAFEMKNTSEAFEAFMMENDGSAWDTCCKSTLRDLTENRILDVMYDKLYKFFTPYNWFQEPRRRADHKKKYKLQINTNKVDVCAFPRGSRYTQDELARAMCKRRAQACIDSIRRSGDRGTSILNWIINIICWAWVLSGGTGVTIVHSNGKVCIDIFGTKRRFKIWLEGDDSLLWLTGRIFTPAELEVLEARWTQLGHRPKLFQRVTGDVAEFCGWKVVVNQYGLDETTAMPDVPRMLANCFYTTAKEAIALAKHGDPLGFGRVVGPALIARAGSIADRAPSIAHWLTRLAGGFTNKDGDTIADEMFSRDDMYRLGVEDMNELLPEWWKNDDPAKLLDTRYGSFCDNVLRQVSNSIATGGLCREADLAVRHGWVKTKSEWFNFVNTLTAVECTTSDEDYRRIVPPGMM